MAENTANNNIVLKIKKVKQVSFSIEEISYNQKELGSALIQLYYYSFHNLETNLFNFGLKVTYTYANSNTPFIQSDSITTYEISDLRKYVDKDNQLSLPNNALLYMVATAIDHARVFMVQNVANTVYNDMILPPFNIADVAKQFFGSKSTEKRE